jgi:similar to spore coat protein
MQEQNLALHEAMEIHEMLNFKTVCMAKSKMMEGLVFDQELKALLEKDVQQSITAVGDLQNLLKKAPTVEPTIR